MVECALTVSSPSLHHSTNRVYSGHHSYLINTYDLEINPALWLSVVSTHKVRDTYCSYAVIDTCCKSLGSSTDVLKVSCTCMCVQFEIHHPYSQTTSAHSFPCTPSLVCTCTCTCVLYYAYFYCWHSLLLPLLPPRAVALTSHV